VLIKSIIFVGVCKKLEAVANKKGCAEVRPWIHSIVNHLYWSASTSDSGEETIAKWSSVANHIQNVHVHDNWHFPLCQHPPINAHTLTKWLISGMLMIYVDYLVKVLFFFVIYVIFINIIVVCLAILVGFHGSWIAVS